MAGQPTLEHGTIRSRLRAATSAQHAAVDRHMGELLRAGPRGYERFLEASAAAVLPLERALETSGAPELLPDWSERVRSGALVADLEMLSLSVGSQQKLLIPSDEAFQLGVLYVLEGSRLGARVLLDALHSTLPPSHIVATHYLSHGHGLRLWTSFLHVLERSESVLRSPELAENGARFAFDVFLE